MFRFASFFISLLVFTSTSKAAENVRYFQNKDHIKMVTTYKDGAGWRIDEFELYPGKLQDLTSSHYFEDTNEALALQKKYGNQNEIDIVSFGQQTPVTTEVKGQSLWTATEEWSTDWEAMFFDWVENNFTQDFFSRHGLASDCADAATLVRWIFARQHRLPAGNTLAGSKIVFSHESMKKKWLHLPTDPVWHKDQRFLAALEYITDNTYTHSIYKDSYPVAVSTQSLRAGTFHLFLSGHGGHTRVIARTDYSPNSIIPITLYWSTLPKIVRDLATEPFVDSNQVSETEGGFRRFRWPYLDSNNKWELTQATDQPDYSLEQYEPDLGMDNFAINIYKKLIPGYDPEKSFIAAIDDLVTYIGLRIDAVKDGYALCTREDCSPGTQNWEDWSTPSRDKKIFNKIAGVEELAASLSELADTSIWERKKSQVSYDIEGKSLSLENIIFIWRGELYSSDPRVSINRRWALNRSAVMDNFMDRLDETLPKREKLVEDGLKNCTPSLCAVGSAQYVALQSYDLDETLKLQSAGVEGFCEKFDFADDCKRPAPKRIITIDNQTWTLDEFFSRLPWFVSDPNESNDRRWGLHSRNFLNIKIPAERKTSAYDPYAFSFAPSKDIHGFVHHDDGQIFDAVTKKIIETPGSCGRVVSWPDSPRLLCRLKSDGISGPIATEMDDPASELVINYYSRAEGWQSFTFPNIASINYDFTPMANGHIFVYASSTQDLLVFQINSSGPKLIKRYSGVTNNNYSMDRNYQFVYDSNKIVTLGVEQGQLKEWIAQRPKEAEYLFSLTSDGGNQLIFNSTASSGPIVNLTHVFNKLTGLVKPLLSEDIHFSDWLDIGKKFIAFRWDDQLSQAKIFDFNSNGEATEFMTFGPGTYVYKSVSNPHLMFGTRSITDFNQSELYRIKNNVVEKFSRSSNEKSPFAVAQYVTFNRGEDLEPTITDFDRNFELTFPPKTQVISCWGNMPTTLCHGGNKRVFLWVKSTLEIDAPNGETLTQTWANLREIIGQNLGPVLMSRSFSPRENRSHFSSFFGPASEAGNGTILEWANNAFLIAE